MSEWSGSRRRRPVFSCKSGVEMAEAPRFECHVGDCQKDCKRTKQRNLSNVLNICHHVENESRTKVSFDVDARVARACVRARARRRCELGGHFIYSGYVIIRHGTIFF